MGGERTFVAVCTAVRLGDQRTFAGAVALPGLNLILAAETALCRKSDTLDAAPQNSRKLPFDQSRSEGLAIMAMLSHFRVDLGY